MKTCDQLGIRAQQALFEQYRRVIATGSEREQDHFAELAADLGVDGVAAIEWCGDQP